jgi:RNA polymerase sigma factor (sigma-70 family)
MRAKVSIGLLAAQADQRLLALAGEGHERAFEAVVQRHHRPLLAYCRRLGLSESRAEDVLQQALLQAWLALQRGCEVREPRAWLYRSVHNTAVNAMRGAPEHTPPLRDSAHSDAAASAELEFERRAAVREALTDVAALPQMQRDAILLTAVDGRSHEEVASALGVTHGAVRGLLHRARATLRGAAAAITPQPVVAWASAHLGRVAPAASRVTVLSAPGGGADVGGVLFKGAAVAATAAVLAAGAGIVPLRSHAHRVGRAAPKPAVAPTEAQLGASSATVVSGSPQTTTAVKAVRLEARRTTPRGPGASAETPARRTPVSSVAPPAKGGEGATHGVTPSAAQSAPQQAPASASTPGSAAGGSSSSSSGSSGAGAKASESPAAEPPAEKSSSETTSGSGGSGGGGSKGAEGEKPPSGEGGSERVSEEADEHKEALGGGSEPPPEHKGD